MADQAKMIIVTSNEDLIRQVSQNKTTNTLVLDLNNNTFMSKNDHDVSDANFLSHLAKLNSTIDQAYKRALNARDQSRSKPTKAPKKSIDLVCTICGDRAIGFNYGVLSCGSCKAFFRRNASQQSKTMRCLTGQNQCSVAHEKYRTCKRCRLEKCFTMGMRKEFLLTEEEKQQRKQRSKTNLKHSSTCQSTNTTQTADELDHLLMDIARDDCDFLQRDIEDSLFGTLSLEDWLIIQTVHSACRSVMETRPARYPSFDLSSRATALISWAQFANQTGLHYIGFFRQLDQFEDLHADDRFLLIKYNLLPLFPVFKCFDYDPSEDCCAHAINERVERHRQFFRLCNESDDTRDSYIDMVRSLAQIIEKDSILVSLLLAILIHCRGISMSEDEPLFHDSLAVYRAQTYYTKLLWSYMLSKQGETKAYKHFTQLLTGIFRIQSMARRYRDFFRFQLTSSITVDKIAPLLQTVLRIS